MERNSSWEKWEIREVLGSQWGDGWVLGQPCTRPQGAPTARYLGGELPRRALQHPAGCDQCIHTAGHSHRKAQIHTAWISSQ